MFISRFPAFQAEQHGSPLDQFRLKVAGMTSVAGTFSLAPRSQPILSPAEGFSTIEFQTPPAMVSHAWSTCRPA
jgi:hypothetical protein